MNHTKQVILSSGILLGTGFIIWKYHLSKNSSFKSLREKLQQILCYGRKDVNVVIVENLDDWKEVSSEFIKEANILQLVGFDVEWFNNGKISLMQLALPNGNCLLLRLNRMNDIPYEIQSILVDKNIFISQFGNVFDLFSVHHVLKYIFIHCNMTFVFIYFARIFRPI